MIVNRGCLIGWEQAPESISCCLPQPLNQEQIFEVHVPYLYIHNPRGLFLLFGHILSHMLDGLENSMEFGKQSSAPLHESKPR